MSATHDRPFADLRAQHDAWMLTQDQEAFDGFLAALAEGTNDARLYFRGYMQGVAARLGVTPPTVQRSVAHARPTTFAEAIAKQEAFEAEHPGAFGEWGVGFCDGYFPDHDFGGDDDDELAAD